MQMCGALNNYYEGAEYSNELLVNINVEVLMNNDDCILIVNECKYNWKCK